MARSRRVLLVLLAVQALACRSAIAASPLEQRLEVLNRVEDMTGLLPDRARASVLGAAYGGLLTPARAGTTLAGVSNGDLDALYRAAQLTAFYTSDETHVRNMVAYLDERHRRGVASRKEYVQMYEAFIRARMLVEARAFASQHPSPELEPVPELREAAELVPGHPTQWVVDPDSRALLRRTVDLRRPAHVVVVSHPDCHFSRDASRDIESDPVLRRIFSEHATWLAPQSGKLELDVFQQWNREHPGQQVTIAFRENEWPMIDIWGTPTFYFFKDGALRSKVGGWPKGGRRSELVAALQQVGLLD